MSETVTVTPPADKFQSRDDLVDYIEQQTATALEKALGPGAVRVERRVPWATSGPVGHDSAGYSVLKAAAFALGYLGPDQAKEELHVHQQLRDLYQGYGFVPHCGHQSFLVPLATAHLPAFEPHGQKLQHEIRAKMAADAGRFDPDEAAWIAGKVGLTTKSLGTISDIAGGSLVSFPVLGELIDLQRNLEVFAAAGAQEVALPPNGRLQFPKLTGGIDGLLGRRIAGHHRKHADHRQSRPAGQEARRARQGEQRTAAVRQPVGRGADAARHGPRGGPARPTWRCSKAPAARRSRA